MFIVVFFPILFSGQGLASPKPNLQPNLHKVYQEALTWAHEQKKRDSKKKKVLHSNVPVSQNCQSCTAPLTEFDWLTPPQSSDSILVFVSFSMPKETLKSLLGEAKRYNATLVLRGLHQESFRKTAQKMKDLVQNYEEGVEINPDLFKTYHVHKVPVFIRLKKGVECARLSGNVTLKWAFQKLKKGL